MRPNSNLEVPVRRSIAPTSLRKIIPIARPQNQRQRILARPRIQLEPSNINLSRESDVLLVAVDHDVAGERLAEPEPPVTDSAVVAAARNKVSEILRAFFGRGGVVT